MATNTITVFVNGEKHLIANAHPHQTLQEYLHEIGLTGTKVSCAQGACGACTVTLSNGANGVVAEKAINSCLRPLLLCDGYAVTTTEGIGCAAKPHPVQQRMAELNASQCGYCTPGQVMSMYGLLRENKTPSVQEVEACLEGNICRCTGYRAIHAACHTFAGRHAATDLPGYPKQYEVYTGEGEPSFPSELMDYNSRQGSLFVEDVASQSKWYRVKDLQQWADIAKDMGFRKPRIVVGNTSAGVFGHKVGAVTNVDISGIPELRGVRNTEDGIVVAGAESLNVLIDALKGGNAAQQTLAGAMSKIANNNVRNAGGWAGNLVMGRVLYFPSDGAVLLSAFGAEVTVAIANNGIIERRQMLADVFVHDTDLNNYNYVLTSIKIPNISSRFLAYRQGMGHSNGHALVNAAFRADMVDGRITGARVVFGCIGKRCILVKEAQSFLEGKLVNQETLQSLLDIVQRVDVEPDATYTTAQNPAGKDAFKRQTILGFCLKWFASLHASPSATLKSIASGSGFWESRDEVFRATQTLTSKAQLNLPDGHPGAVYVGPKKESWEQACGQTRYSGDMPMGPRGVYGCYVTASRAAKLTNIDASEALKQEGVVTFVSAKDVPGMNSCSLVPGEEPVFAEVGKDIIYVGQIIGMLVAKTHRQAKSASRMVKCTYSESEAPPTFTLEEAESKKSFLYGPDFPGKTLNTGDVDAAFADPENIIIEGNHNFGGQNNFYMEKHTCIAMPDDMGRVQVYGGCQCPDNTKTHVMIALGCSSHDIVIQNRPMGGAFGGKFTRQFSTFCASAIAAKSLGRPVRIAMDLHQDMGSSGNTRHICRTHYKIAASKGGKIVGVDNRMLIDAGCANDFTDFIADEILKKQDYAYDLPNFRGTLNITKTNMPNASAVRAPGLAQGLAITETMIDAVAHNLNMTQEQVREINMKQLKSESYVPRDQTGQEITEWNMPTLWAECKTAFDFEAREHLIAEFNAVNRYKKRGIAMQPLKYTVGYLLMSGAQATVNINAADGTVAIQTGCCEMGQGCLTKVISTAASVLGIPYEKVSAFYPNSSVLPNLQTDGGSAGTEVLCHATADACRILKDRLKPVEEVLLEEKKASAQSGEDVTATWEEICARAFGPMPTDTRISLSATAMHSDPKYNAIKRTKDHPPAALPFWNLDPIPDDMWQYYTTGCAATEVEVDVLTGGYTVLRADVVLDAGNSLNPLIDLGQAEGGYVYGLGCYLQEEVLMDAASGRNKSDGTWNYKPPGNKDVPQVFNVSLHPGNQSSRTMFGSKGIGEAPFLLGYSAVSAIRVAVRASRLERGLGGEFQLDSPATVDRVQQVLGMRPADLSLE